MGVHAGTPWVAIRIAVRTLAGTPWVAVRRAAIRGMAHAVGITAGPVTRAILAALAISLVINNLVVNNLRPAAERWPLPVLIRQRANVGPAPPRKRKAGGTTYATTRWRASQAPARNQLVRRNPAPAVRKPRPVATRVPRRAPRAKRQPRRAPCEACAKGSTPCEACAKSPMASESSPPAKKDACQTCASAERELVAPPLPPPDGVRARHLPETNLFAGILPQWSESQGRLRILRQGEHPGRLVARPLPPPPGM